MEFSLKQLSWIVIGSLGIGGSGYVSMSTKIEEMDKRLAVVAIQMERLQIQLDRIEVKLEKRQ